MASATIVIATTGAEELSKAVGSALDQEHADTQVWVVIDGPQFAAAAQERLACLQNPRLKLMVLPENTGGNGFYGHRIYAAAGHLINTDYALLLDQDNWLDADHVSTLIAAAEANGWQWGHSLRKITDPKGNFLCLDDCESLGKWPIHGLQGKHLVDTSCYCIRREIFAQISVAWHGGWGADRRFFAAINKHFPRWGTSGRYTLNYRLAGNPNSLTLDIIERGNALMDQKYKGKFPWRAG
jgi:hypothetical protein